MIKKDKALRDRLKEVRRGIGEARRSQAEGVLMGSLYEALRPYKKILSYAAKGSEVDLEVLNQKLCAEGRLLLPKVEGELLKAYLITDLETELQVNNRFKILEPLGVCHPVVHSDIDCLLVPGLGFDDQGHRIGYGLGHYDRLLSKVTSMSIGIAFSEQKLAELIDKEPHDRVVDRVFYI